MKIKISWDDEKRGWIFENISDLEWYFTVFALLDFTFTKPYFVASEYFDVKDSLIDDCLHNGIKVIVA